MTSDFPLPLLAYVYHPHSFATLDLVAAAQGRCRILWVIDTSDPEVTSMARLLRRFGACVDVAGLDVDHAAQAVANFSPLHLLALADDCLVFAAQLALRLDIEFASPDVACSFTNKEAQRIALGRGGLKVPRQWVISDDHPDVFALIARDTRFPAVLKPRHGEASRDTLPVSSFSHLQELWESEGFARSSRPFVLEEYIADAGKPLAGIGFAGYVSVESLVQNSRVCHLAINGRMPPAFPFRETGFFIPAALDDDLAAEVLEVAERAAHALDVRQGCLHTEIKLSPSGPIVIEVNGRIGGGVPEMLFAATGVKLLELAFDIALGVPIDFTVPDVERLAYLFYVQAPSEMTRVLAVEGLEELRKVRGVQEVILNRGPGQEVSWRLGNHGHVFSVFGTAASHDELRQVNEIINQLVVIEGS